MTLIKHVLQSIPMHVIAAFGPLKVIIKMLEAIFATFFWGTFEFGHNYH